MQQEASAHGSGVIYWAAWDGGGKRVYAPGVPLGGGGQGNMVGPPFSSLRTAKERENTIENSVSSGKSNWWNGDRAIG